MTTERSPLLDKETLETEYRPLKWRTMLDLERDGIVKVIRIGRRCFLLRPDIEQMIADGGRQFPQGWKGKTKRRSRPRQRDAGI
jgi:hypothetical protein